MDAQSIDKARRKRQREGNEASIGQTAAANPNLQHRQRLRDRFLANGRDAFADHELLELLLTYAIPRKDVKPLAKSLLAHFGSLAAVFEADISDLARRDGVGEATAILLQLVRDLKARAWESQRQHHQPNFFNNPDNAHAFFREKIGGNPRDEHFHVAYLNTKNRLIYHEEAARGTIDAACVHPRRIIRTALEKNASAIILAHNHPSGDATPSDQDILLTQQINNACKQMDLRVLDHIIIGCDNNYTSLKSSGLF